MWSVNFQMNPKHLLTPWLCLFLFFVAVDSKHKQDIAKQQAVKSKLLRRAAHNLQWEVDQAHSRNAELDMLRWMRWATELRHADWALITKTIYVKAREYGLRPELMLAVAHRESNFNPTAQSAVAMGIMQVNYGVWADSMSLDKQSILDIETNIDAACRIMRMYLDEAGGDEVKALTYYNCGYLYVNPRYVPRVKSSKFYVGGR